MVCGEDLPPRIFHQLPNYLSAPPGTTNRHSLLLVVGHSSTATAGGPSPNCLAPERPIIQQLRLIHSWICTKTRHRTKWFSKTSQRVGDARHVTALLVCHCTRSARAQIFCCIACATLLFISQNVDQSTAVSSRHGKAARSLVHQQTERVCTTLTYFSYARVRVPPHPCIHWSSSLSGGCKKFKEKRNEETKKTGIW